MTNLENLQQYEENKQFTKDDAEEIATALRKETWEKRKTVQSRLESKFLDNAKNTQKQALTTATIDALKAKSPDAVNAVIRKLEQPNETWESEQRQIAWLLALHDLLTWGKGIKEDIIAKKETTYKTILTPTAQAEKTETPTEEKITINWAEVTQTNKSKKTELQWKVNTQKCKWADWSTEVTFWLNETIVTTKSTANSAFETHYVEKDGNLYKITETNGAVTLAYDATATKDVKDNEAKRKAAAETTEKEKEEELQSKHEANENGTNSPEEQKTAPETQKITINNIDYTVGKAWLPNWLTPTVYWTKIKLSNAERDMANEQDKTQTKIIKQDNETYAITPEIKKDSIGFEIRKVDATQANALLTKEKWSHTITINDQFFSTLNEFTKISDKVGNNEKMKNEFKSLFDNILNAKDINESYITGKYTLKEWELAKTALEPLSNEWVSKDILINNNQLTNIGNAVREYHANSNIELGKMLKQITDILNKNNNNNEYTQCINACSELAKSTIILSDYMRTEPWFINIINAKSGDTITWLDFYKNTANADNTIQFTPNNFIKYFQTETDVMTATDNFEKIQSTATLKATQESITTITNNMKPYPLPWTNPPELFYFHPQQILDQWFATKTWENISLIPNKDQLLREAINDKKLTAISVSSLVSKLYENPNIHILPWEKGDRRDESDADQRGFLEKFTTWKAWTLDKKIGTLDPNQIGTELGKLGYNTKPNNINIIKDQPARTLTTSAIEKANQNLPIIKIKIGDTESFITKQDYNKLAGLDKNGKLDIWNKESKNIATKNGQEQTTLQTDTVKLFAQKYDISWTNIQPNWDRWIMIVPDDKKGNEKYNGVTIYVDKNLKLYGDWINTTTNPIQCTPENLLTRIDAMKKISTAIRQSQDRVNNKKNKASDTQRWQLAFLQTYAKRLITGETLTTTTQPPAIAKKETYWLSADIDFTNKVNINDFTFIEIDKESNKEDKNKNFFTYTKKI